MPSKVCVIVPTVGNPEELGVVLDGLASQSFSDMEVVVVGPGGDPGREIALQRGVRYLDEGDSKTRADACNLAIEETGELHFFDAECGQLLYTVPHGTPPTHHGRGRCLASSFG